MGLDVDATRVTGRWIKHVYPGAQPLALRHPPPDNRWQRGDVVEALYLAADEQTAWAEWYRHLAGRGLPPNQQVPRDLWTWEVDVVVADLSGASQLSRVRLTTPRPSRRTWPDYQRFGEHLAGDGWAGLLAPSAARPDHLVLCLFRAADGTVPDAYPLAPPRRINEPPVPPTGMTT